MQYNYGEFNGTNFPTPDSLFASPEVIKLILQFGQEALDAMQNFDDEDQEIIQGMIDAGLLERDEKTGQLRMTPKLVRGIEHRSLLDIFQNLSRGNRDGHQTVERGRSSERIEGTKTYEFGDPISEIDLGTTMRNALAHQVQLPVANFQNQDSPRVPITIGPNDFEIHLSEGQTDTAVCVLLDMSGSMMRYGRFFQAKRVAMGMASLLRSRFPQDTIDYVGFYSTACRIKEEELPLVMPKPISMHDYQVRLRVPLDKAMQSPQKVPQHFTNLQLGMRLARQVLARRSAANKQMFIITDGQPTAHVETSTTGEEILNLIYPPSEKTTMATLHEALRCQQQGIRTATFALIEDYWGMDWVGFVDKLTRLTRGVAYYCTSEDLSSTVVESYLSGKKKKSFVH